MTSKIRLFRFAVLILAIAVAQPAMGKTLRVGIPGFPSVGGNALGLVNLPGLYTFAAAFDALTYVDNEGRAQPQLALSWTADSETTWQFRLRQDAGFSNGEPFNAAAVVANFKILKGPDAPALVAARELAQIASVREIDQWTVEIVTSNPDPFLPQNLSMLRFVAPMRWAELGRERFALEPVGAGSYQVESWGSTEIAFVPSPHAWREPESNRLELIAAPDPSARVQGLLSGDLDLALALGPDEIGLVEAAGHSMAVQPDTGMILLAFILTKESPLNDIRVRRALNLAVNQDAIVAGLIDGQTPASTQTASHISFGFDRSIEAFGYDPDEARRLLAEAGYPDGFSFVAEIQNVTSSFQGAVYQQVVADLARVGVGVELRAIPIASYAKGLFQGEWGGQAFGVDYGIAPSLDALRAFGRHSCLWPNPWYCDEDIMPLLNEALGTFDLDHRRQLTKEVLKRQRDQVPGILLYDQVRFDAVGRSVTGYVNHLGYLPYAEFGLAD